MGERIRDVMTADPVSLRDDSTVVDAARAMRDSHIGDVIVLDDEGTVCRIVTDRDIVVRALAESREPGSTTLGEICTGSWPTSRRRIRWETPFGS